MGGLTPEERRRLLAKRRQAAPVPGPGLPPATPEPRSVRWLGAALLAWTLALLTWALVLWAGGVLRWGGER